MLNYNTQLKKLILPEYGRNIQQMVDHCRTIEDRDERNRCAQAVIKAMAVLFPAVKQGGDDARHKLWDHLAIMADFDLDIDYPWQVIRPDELQEHPGTLSHEPAFIRLRHYGSITERMLKKAQALDDGPEREALVMLLANQMKKSQLAVNPDGVDDAKIFADIAALTHGDINLDPATHRLCEYKLAPQPTGKKRKKK